MRGKTFRTWSVVIALVASLALVGCNDSKPSNAASGGTSSTAPTPETTPSAAPKSISQPNVGDLAVAPEGKRVDLAVPTFSDSANITNLLFPGSLQESVLLLGKVDGMAFRTEVTLLSNTRIIEWEGQQVEALVSQYVAFLDGRIHEVAYDFYAQDDEGAVWYFGEDVFNFADGAIADTHGTWIAGNDGPAAMIMPADPQVGDVYRPENIPGFVFEEVTVKAIDETLPGPLGPVEGGLVIEELHMDGTTEKKTFAPGYGEFYTAGGGDVEALALAVPTDALSDPSPADLGTLQKGWARAFDAATAGDWKSASSAARQMSSAWKSYQAGEEVPKRIEPLMTAALGRLGSAAQAQDAPKTKQAAIDAAQSTLDLQLRYQGPIDVDLARFDLWLAQMLADSAARDAAAVKGDFFSLDYIRDRILHALNEDEATRVNYQLEELLDVVNASEFGATSRLAQKMRRTFTSS